MKHSMALATLETAVLWHYCITTAFIVILRLVLQQGGTSRDCDCDSLTVHLCTGAFCAQIVGFRLAEQ